MKPMEMEVAVCREPLQIQIERHPVEELGPDDALVRISYCGVCPWDLRAFVGLSSSVRYPLRLGHEVSGVVEAVGTKVHKVKPGDRVVVDVIRRCKVCTACLRGLENHCENADFSRGGFAQYIVAPTENVYQIKDGTPLIEAALTEPLACVVRGQNRIGVGRNNTALLVGSGPMGLLHLQVLKRNGAKVIVSDLIEERLEIARGFGADVTLNPDREDLAQVVNAETDGFGVDAAVIATSRIEAVRRVLPLLGIDGRLLLFAGIYPKAEMTLDPNLIHYREIWVTGSADYTPADFMQSLQLIENKEVKIEPLISNVYPLSEIARAFATLEAQDGLKVVVRCNDPETLEPET